MGETNIASKKRLFSYPDINGDPEESQHKALSPYLFAAAGLSNPHIAVRSISLPSNGLRRLVNGSKPIDGGHYIFKTEVARTEFVTAEPAVEPYMRPFIGAREFLHSQDRWILALHDAPPNLISAMPRVRARIAAVRSFRAGSGSKSTQQLAETPLLFHLNVIPTTPFLVIPMTSSERREYLPVGWLEPPCIPSNAVFVLDSASLQEFGLLTSAMHMAWLRYIGGRLESRYRYSIGLVYNTFPTPSGWASNKTLQVLAQAVLDARLAYPDATLANLYDPDSMPPRLRRLIGD